MHCVTSGAGDTDGVGGDADDGIGGDADDGVGGDAGEETPIWAQRMGFTRRLAGSRRGEVRAEKVEQDPVPVVQAQVPVSPAPDSIPRTPGTPHVCIICMERPRDALLLHAGDEGHTCTCFRCAQQLVDASMTCPICRQPILRVIKHFRS